MRSRASGRIDGRSTAHIHLRRWHVESGAGLVPHGAEQGALHDNREWLEYLKDRIPVKRWPAGTKLMLHAAVGFGASPVAELMLPEDRNRAQKMLEPATSILREAGLNVSTTVVEDDPKNSIVNAAERMAADCILVGDNDDNALGRLFLGTVVEIIR